MLCCVVLCCVRLCCLFDLRDGLCWFLVDCVIPLYPFSRAFWLVSHRCRLADVRLGRYLGTPSRWGSYHLLCMICNVVLCIAGYHNTIDKSTYLSLSLCEYVVNSSEILDVYRGKRSEKLFC